MILIPEIETVVILVPRTGTGSLRKAVAARYPRAIELYRHMEADGVPQAYDRWRRVGVVRHPVARLWSLYKFMRDFGLHRPSAQDPEYIAAMQRSASTPFCDWLVHNETTFSDPYSRKGPGIHPFYACRHPMPENRKSQFVYLRPDLGTEVFQFDRRLEVTRALDLEPWEYWENGTSNAPHPYLTRAAEDHINRFFAWDIAASLGRVSLRADGTLGGESVERNRPAARASERSAPLCGPIS